MTKKSKNKFGDWVVKNRVLTFVICLVVALAIVVGISTFAGTCALGNNTGCPVLKQGSSGASVKVLQKELYDSCFDQIAVDGAFGPKTKAAVVGFQKVKRLTADGIAGPKTWTSLQAEYNWRKAHGMLGICD